MDGWLAVAVGVGVMAGQAALRVCTHRLSRRASDAHTALAVEVGGVVVRMGGVLAGMALVFIFTPVHEEAFAGTVLALLVLSLVVEIWVFSRREALSAPGRE
ncbi:MAG: hypothetical protein BRD55_03720 [Bacteroidetes bacterium SW_9_63_38]|nr:MAG: hypothetical protein BRD55_03720 [Bacteroidetes bacterium SW_9_63_38]